MSETEPCNKSCAPGYCYCEKRPWQGLTQDEMEQIAHRTCWKYKHSADPHHSHTYTFNRSTLDDLRYVIEAKLKERNA